MAQCDPTGAGGEEPAGEGAGAACCEAWQGRGRSRYRRAGSMAHGIGGSGRSFCPRGKMNRILASADLATADAGVGSASDRFGSITGLPALSRKVPQCDEDSRWRGE
jgi:hypothetical protein